MYYSDYTTTLLYQDKLREMARRRSQAELIRDASELTPNETHDGLISRIKQWTQRRDQRQQQETVDVRRVPAL